jgi:hypothetical protein
VFETTGTAFVHSSTQPAAGNGQDTTKLFVSVGIIVSHGRLSRTLTLFVADSWPRLSTA